MGGSFIPHAVLFVLLLTSMVMKPSRYRWLMWLSIASLVPSIFFSDNLPPWYWRFWALFLFAIRSVACINTPHILLSIVSVGTFITEPEGWPPLFGKLGDAYTVRKFWGRTWHQSLRRVVSSPGKHLARRLHLPAGSYASSYIQLYTAFVMHGILHMQPTDFRPLYFFLAQPLAVILEEIVITAAARAGYHPSTLLYKTLGYAWVFCWFTFCIPGYMDSLISWGMVDPPFNIGLTSGILRHFGAAKG